MIFCEFTVRALNENPYIFYDNNRTAEVVTAAAVVVQWNGINLKRRYENVFRSLFRLKLWRLIYSVSTKARKLHKLVIYLAEL